MKDTPPTGAYAQKAGADNYCHVRQGPCVGVRHCCPKPKLTERLIGKCQECLAKDVRLHEVWFLDESGGRRWIQGHVCFECSHKRKFKRGG